MKRGHVSTPGLKLRAIAANVPASAPQIRLADIMANPGSHDIALRSTSIFNQQELPCCVSCALTSAMESRDRLCPALAPLFHYHVTRFDRGAADAQGAIFLGNGLTTLASDGICRRDLYNQPFTDEGAMLKPSTRAYEDASSRALHEGKFSPSHIHKSEGASRVAWAREQLRKDLPVVIGFKLPPAEAYPKKFLDDSYSWLDPNKFQGTSDGHCVLAFGYNDLRQVFHIQDSMGIDNFDNGCWWMGYRIMDSEWVQDAYCLTT